jgi:uncharacterized protein (DUF1810 family)
MAGIDDPFDLQRFVAAQDRIYSDVVDELTEGRKQSHWMWFVFPQLKGLGRSGTAMTYGIGSRAEARAYLAHPVLGPRLRECARLTHAIDGRSAREVFGWPDELKLQSSMTLFAHAANRADARDFRDVLAKFYDGEDDATTVQMWESLAERG